MANMIGYSSCRTVLATMEHNRICHHTYTWTITPIHSLQWRIENRFLFMPLHSTIIGFIFKPSATSANTNQLNVFKSIKPTAGTKRRNEFSLHLQGVHQTILHSKMLPWSLLCNDFNIYHLLNIFVVEWMRSLCERPRLEQFTMALSYLKTRLRFIWCLD